MRLIRLLKTDLAQESTTWVAQGLITREQAESICALYGADYDAAEQGTRGYRVLVVLGYLFFGLALITLLSANWEEIPRAVRMGGLLGLTLAVNGCALWLYRTQRDRAAEGLFLLGGLVYGASIILIAQIYHLGEHMPDGVFWWALGTAPAALLLVSPLLALLSVALAVVWFFVEMQLGYFAPGLLGFLALGAYVLCVGRRSVLLLLTVFAGAGLFIETALSAWFLDGAYYRFQFHAEHWPVGAAYILFVFAFSQWLSAQPSHTARDYGAVLSLWSLRFALLVAFVLSYHEPWEEAIKASWSAQSVLWTLVGGLCGAALLCAWRAGCLRVVAGLSVGLVALVATVAGSDNTEHALALQVLANVAVVALGIGLIRRGVHHGESHAFFLGVATVLLLALLRYADLIGDYVGTAVLFVVIAVVLLGAARFWQSRRATGGES